MGGQTLFVSCKASLTPESVRVQDSINAIEQLILDKNWEAARDAVVKLKYLEGIEIAAKDKWHELSR